MSASPERAASGWSADPERSNLWLLRTMRWIAIRAGRPLARVVLHPITLYFLLANGSARRASSSYLGRVLGRPARWPDVYRHIHRFAATVLDRVYFLQERCDPFQMASTGADAIHAPARPWRRRDADRRTPGQLRGLARHCARARRARGTGC